MFRWETNKKEIIAVWLGVAAVVLSVGSVWLWQQKRQVSLLSFAPRGTSDYWQLNFEQPEFKEKIKTDSDFKAGLEKWLSSFDLPVNIWRGDYSVEKLARAKVAWQGKNGKREEAYAWLIYSRDDLSDVVATGLKGYYCRLINRHVAMLTESEKLNYAYRPLKSDVDREYARRLGNIKNSAAGGFNQLYVSELAGDKKEKVILSWLVETSGKRDFKFLINWYSQRTGLLWQPMNVGAAKRLNFKLPPAAVLWSGNNLDGLIDGALEHIRRETDIDMEELKAFIESKYKVNLNLLYTFFEQPFYVLFKPKKEMDLHGLSDARNYDYALLAYGLPNDKAWEQVKKMISAYHAFQYPEKKKKFLPDGSFGWELRANIAGWLWTERKEKEAERGWLARRPLGWNYYLRKKKPLFILSSSRSWLDEVVKWQAGKESNLKQLGSGLFFNGDFWQAVGLPGYFNGRARCKKVLSGAGWQCRVDLEDER